jgi:hypothetical protein
MRSLSKGEKADCVLPGFLGFSLYSRDYHRTPGITIVLLGLPSYFRGFHCTPGIAIVLLRLLLYSRDCHHTLGITIVLSGRGCTFTLLFEKVNK